MQGTSSYMQQHSNTPLPMQRGIIDQANGYSPFGLQHSMVQIHPKIAKQMNGRVQRKAVPVHSFLSPPPAVQQGEDEQQPLPPTTATSKFFEMFSRANSPRIPSSPLNQEKPTRVPSPLSQPPISSPSTSRNSLAEFNFDEKHEFDDYEDLKPASDPEDDIRAPRRRWLRIFLFVGFLIILGLGVGMAAYLVTRPHSGSSSSDDSNSSLSLNGNMNNNENPNMKSPSMSTASPYFSPTATAAAATPSATDSNECTWEAFVHDKLLGIKPCKYVPPSVSTTATPVATRAAGAMPTDG